MGKKKSSHRWLREHFDDEFVKRAQKAGYRSRAWFKLEEIDKKYNILNTKLKVLDLGAAPGGWSQYVGSRLGRSGQIFALDILPMEPLEGVSFLQGDFREQAVLDQLLEAIPSREVDLVLSDMAPNISGMDAIDQPRSMYLAELAADVAAQVLARGGTFLVKVFQGEGFDDFLRKLRTDYGKVVSVKPRASRDRSREVYLLARNYNL